MIPSFGKIDGTALKETSFGANIIAVTIEHNKGNLEKILQHMFPT